MRTRGSVLLETVVALLLTVILAALVLRTLVQARAVGRGMAGHAEALAAVRVARTVLGADGPDRERGGVSSDTLAVRAFRGTVVLCGGDAPVVRGIRGPDPEKDSILLLSAEGWSVHALGAGPAGGEEGLFGCADGAGWWRVDPPAPGGALVGRYFERGSFHLAAGALRYRTGAGGRQPLTPEVLVLPESRFEAGPGGHRLLLHTTAGAPWRVPLGLPEGPPGG